jgi:5'(3')-deoxyribonucleotidase
MKIKKLYLDMDGVITDFRKKYVELFNVNPSGYRERKEEENGYWDQFVDGHNFEKLDWYPGGVELMKEIRKLNIPIEILTSSGGKKHHNEVEHQKKVWLKTQGFTYPVNVVPGRDKKAEFATPDSILIDDTADVIEGFVAAGGIGILHTGDVRQTIDTLKKHLDEVTI